MNGLMGSILNILLMVKKIFEGDIVESPNGTQGLIEWQNAECAFLVNIGDDWQTMDDCPYEVVGNIYDNKGYEK